MHAYMFIMFPQLSSMIAYLVCDLLSLNLTFYTYDNGTLFINSLKGNISYFAIKVLYI